jgi:hypothetical protein
MRIHVSVQTNHFFGNTNTQKTVAKEKTFTQKKNHLLCICVLVYRGKEITAFVFQQKLFLDFVKKPMITQPNNNNATVMARAMNGDGDSKSRGGGSGVQWRRPQRWWLKEQRQWWWWRRQWRQLPGRWQWRH